MKPVLLPLFLFALAALLPWPAAAQDKHGEQAFDLLQSSGARAFRRLHELQSVVINAANVGEFRELVPAELLSHVRSGALALNAVSSLDYELPPFARSAKLRGASPDADTLLDAVVAAQREQRNIAAFFRLFGLKDGQPFFEVGGVLKRSYPGGPGSAAHRGQLFRELISFTSPAAISPYLWLTYRFEGGEDDVLWVFSPATRTMRQLTGSNRADGIMRTSFSPDDFFSWSGKPELADGRVLGIKPLLVPFPDMHGVSSSRDGSCVTVRSTHADDNAGDGTQRWNYATHRFPQAAGWIPSDAVFALRDVMRLELEARDPYVRYGRQALYIDVETGLPMYKFVFDRAGRPWKLVMSGYGPAKGAENDHGFPFAAFTVVDDVQKGEAYVVDFSIVKRCEQLPASESLADFDPRRLAELASAEIAAREKKRTGGQDVRADAAAAKPKATSPDKNKPLPAASTAPAALLPPGIEQPEEEAPEA